MNLFWLGVWVGCFAYTLLLALAWAVLEWWVDHRWEPPRATGPATGEPCDLVQAVTQTDPYPLDSAGIRNLPG